MAATDQPQRPELERDLFRERDTVDVGLRVLDHQIVGEQDQMLGNVDNLEVRETAEGLVVTGLVVGPAGLGPRMPGRLGRWMVAVWRRLRPDEDPQLMVLPLGEVRGVDSAVHVTGRAATSLANTAGIELWLRKHLVSRIPGAKEGEDRLAGEPLGEEVHTAGLHAEGRLLGDLLGAAVRDLDGGDVGIVLDVGCTAFERIERSGRQVLGRLRVVDLVVGRTAVGARLGYVEESHTGPWLVQRLVDRLHRDDRRVPYAAVTAIDWDARAVTVRSDAGHVGSGGSGGRR